MSSATNVGKVRESAEPLGTLGMDKFPEIGDIVEDGNSFEANAFIRARTAAAHTGLVSIADDSGLEVGALSREHPLPVRKQRMIPAKKEHFA